MGFLKSDFLKNVGVLFSSTGIAQLISFLIIPVLARIYTPAEHGVITLFSSIIGVCVAFVGFRYDQAIIVEDDDDKARHLAVLSFITTLIWCIILLVVIALFDNYFYGLFNTDTDFPWLYWLPPAIAAASGTEILVMWLNRSRRYKKLASNRVFGMVSGSAYKLAHPFQSFITGNGLVIGQTVGHVLQMLVLIPLRRLSSISISTSTLKEVAVKYKSFPLLATPSALINIIGSFMPVFLIAPFLGDEMTGFYGNAVKLTFIPMGAVSGAVGQVYFERLARLKSNKSERSKLTSDLLRFLFWLAVVPVTILMIWGDQIIPFILGSDWQESGPIAQVTVLYFFAMYLTGPFSAAYEVFNKLNRQLWLTSAFTLLTLASMYFVLQQTENLLLALAAHAFVGIIIRILMLIDCFKLIESSIASKLFKALLIVGGLTLLNWLIKYWLN